MMDQDFIITSLQPWDITIGFNAKDIAIEISKQNRVLFINTPLDIKTYFSKEQTPETIQRRQVIRKEKPVLRQINPNLWVLDLPFAIWPVNFIPDGIFFDFVNKINNKKIFRFISQTLTKLDFKNYILFIDNDIYRSLYGKEFLAPKISIYYRRDNLVSPFWIKHTRRLEPLICKKSDLVLTNSIQLADSVKKYNPRTYNIGQGVDLSQYDTKTSYIMPQYLKQIPPPIIGYAGWITSKRLDADLLFNLAKEKKEYSFVMVGGEDDYFKNHPIHSLPNVYFTGEKKSSEMPAYIAFFDICLNPQKINEITIGNYPRKVDEYLALGKPVIATKTTTMELFDGYVWNCTGIQEYLNAFEEALSQRHSSEKDNKIKFAQSHSWYNCINQIYCHIKDAF